MTNGHYRAAMLRKLVRQQQKGPYKVPVVYDHEAIRDCLLRGLSLSATAKEIGCSNWPVQVVRKELIQMGLISPRGKYATNSKIGSTKQTLGLQAGARKNDKGAWFYNREHQQFSGLRRQIYSEEDTRSEEKEEKGLGQSGPHGPLEQAASPQSDSHGLMKHELYVECW